jgi:hypothetical protein
MLVGVNARLGGEDELNSTKALRVPEEKGECGKGVETLCCVFLKGDGYHQVRETSVSGRETPCSYKTTDV